MLAPGEMPLAPLSRPGPRKRSASERLPGRADGAECSLSGAAVHSSRSRLSSRVDATKPGLASLVAPERVAGDILGDPAAARKVDDAIRLICIKLGGVVNLLDIKLIVMGGALQRRRPGSSSASVLTYAHIF